jgi:hypothetical protein
VNSKQSLIKRSLSLFLALFALTACGTDLETRYKIYYLEPAQGLVRKQAKEVLPFSRAKGYRCATQQDFITVSSCIQAELKVYYLEPAKGLVRKQAGEVKPFSECRGYRCVSPADFEGILDDCAAAESRAAD